MAENSSKLLQHMWTTAPRRITKDQGGKAVFGGVCTGFGARYNKDPVAMRIAFVIIGFIFGGGIFAYLLCWLLMPRLGQEHSPAQSIFTPKDQLSPVERKERRTGWWLILGLIIFVPAANELTSLSGALGGFAVFLVIWFVAYLSQPEPPAPQQNHDLLWG